MFEPLRFLHVADAGLDQPLGDVGPLPAPFQQLAKEASLTAFEQMITGAVSQNVDCVLFAGDMFCERDQSLRAHRALLDGLHKLNEHNIRVFVLPGSDDPETAWREIPNLPANVTVLEAGDADDQEAPVPVAILREGRVIATITAGTFSQLSAKSESDFQGYSSIAAPSENGCARSSPFRIGLFPAWPDQFTTEARTGEERADLLSACRCDYLAMPAFQTLPGRFEAGQTLTTRDGIAHHPGRLQARFARETGPHGATLIEVDDSGEIRGTFLPFAAVRYLRLEMPIEPDTSLEDLAVALSLQLLEETEQPGEQAWFVTWLLQGCGTFFDSLQSPDVTDRLIEALPKTAGVEDSIRVHHQLRFRESAFSMEVAESRAELERLYLGALEDVWADESTARDIFSSALLSEIPDLENIPWRDQLLPLGELDGDDVLARARSLGSEWFHETPEE